MGNISIFHTLQDGGVAENTKIVVTVLPPCVAIGILMNI